VAQLYSVELEESGDRVGCPLQLFAGTLELDYRAQLLTITGHDPAHLVVGVEGIVQPRGDARGEAMLAR